MCECGHGRLAHRGQRSNRQCWDCGYALRDGGQRIEWYCPKYVSAARVLLRHMGGLR